MALLVVNFGSSSLKLSVFVKGESLFSLKGSRDQFTALLKRVHDEFDITTIAHRFVHGGSHDKPLLIKSQKDLLPLKKLLPLAPLHNPFCYEGIKKCLKFFAAINVAIFDTSFFHHLPFKSRIYALPEKITEKYGIRRYGFHGLAHEALLKSVKGKRVITVHLGSGASIAAHFAGKPIDISMGFTPLEGLVMSTRGGDIDPGIIAMLSHKEDVETILNHESGLKGLSGTSDMAFLVKEPSHKNTVDIYCYRAQKYIGAYIAALGGLDTLVFSGGIGENCPLIRKELCPKWFGGKIDMRKNSKTKELTPGELVLISSSDSKIKIYAMGANENQMIAHHALQALKTNKLD